MALLGTSPKAKSRAKNPAWLMALSGLGPSNGDNDGVDWCCLCLRKEGDESDVEESDGNLEERSACESGKHLFCWRCKEACGGDLLSRHGRCPLCRLGAHACGFNTLVQEAEPLQLPYPEEDWSGCRRLLLRETLSAEDRCELATAIAADRCRLLRQSMRPKPKQKRVSVDPKPAERKEALEPTYDPSDVGEVMQALIPLLPTRDSLPKGLCGEMAVVSNSSALLGRELGVDIDSHTCVVRFNEYARVGLKDYASDVGTRTTCHVVSNQVLSEGALDDEALLKALKSTPMTLWMPPMAWGNSMYYARYISMLLGCTTSDGLELTQGERRRVALLRPSVSFAMWKYFRPWRAFAGKVMNDSQSQHDVGEGINTEESQPPDKKDLGDEMQRRPAAGTTGFKFALLAMGMSDKVTLYGFEDDPRNGVDPTGGHYFNKKHSQEVSTYDISWERQQLRRYEDMDCVRLVPTHRTATVGARGNMHDT